MKTKTTLTVAGMAAASLLVVSLAVWLIVENRHSDSAEHAQRCAEFDARIAQDVYYANTDAAQLESRRAPCTDASLANSRLWFQQPAAGE